MNDRFSDEELRAAFAPKSRAQNTTRGPDCPNPEALLAALRGEGEEEERLRLLDHAFSCDACRRELALLHAVSTNPAAGRSAYMPRLRRLVPIAAAASIATITLIGLNQYFNRGSVMRGGAANGVALIAPRGNAVAKDPTRFVWHAVPGATRYTL